MHDNLSLSILIMDAFVLKEFDQWQPSKLHNDLPLAIERKALQ